MVAPCENPRTARVGSGQAHFHLSLEAWWWWWWRSKSCVHSIRGWQQRAQSHGHQIIRERLRRTAAEAFASRGNELTFRRCNPSY